MKKSFYDWCIENERLEILQLWDYELNSFSPKEISFSSHKKCYFKCSRGLHDSYLKSPNMITYKGKYLPPTCAKCESFGQVCIDKLGAEFLDKVWSSRNNISPFEIHANSNNKIYLRCIDVDYHEDYLISCHRFLNGSGCPQCKRNGGDNIHKKDSLGEIFKESLKVWSEENILSPFDYAPTSNKKVYWKCENNKHDSYSRSIVNSTRYDFKCPKCSKEKTQSHLQEAVSEYLHSLDYTILHEHECTIRPINPKTKQPLPFDNEIVELKLIIEVNGQQHYKVDSWNKLMAKRRNTTPKQEFFNQRVRDRYKNYIAWKNGYKILYLPYWLFDKNNSWKKEIERVLHKTK